MSQEAEDPINPDEAAERQVALLDAYRRANVRLMEDNASLKVENAKLPAALSKPADALLDAYRVRAARLAEENVKLAAENARLVALNPVVGHNFKWRTTLPDGTRFRTEAVLLLGAAWEDQPQSKENDWAVFHETGVVLALNAVQESKAITPRRYDAKWQFRDESLDGRRRKFHTVLLFGMSWSEQPESREAGWEVLTRDNFVLAVTLMAREGLDG